MCIRDRSYTLSENATINPDPSALTAWNEEWQADEDTCSFKAKGFTVKLRIAEKEAPKTCLLYTSRCV